MDMPGSDQHQRTKKAKKVDLRSALHLPLQPLPLLPRHPRRTVTVLLLEYPHLLDSLSHCL